MAKKPGKDPAFLFYPGSYLRDTQCLSEPVQVAYDRIMCEHMRNICITQEQLNFFTKRLTEDQKNELLHVLEKVPGGYCIEWVAKAIEERREYSESRRKNREGKGKEQLQKPNIISKTYVQHMEDVNENAIKIENDITRIGGMGERTGDFIDVDGEIVTDVLPILEYYEAQLNGTMRENGNIAWRPLVSKWFSEHIGESFKDRLHVKNSFKKFYLTAPRNGKVVLERNIDHL